MSNKKFCQTKKKSYKKMILSAAASVLRMVVVFVATVGVNGSGIVGPGAMTSYGGPARKSRFGGYTTVRDPAHGFFVGGSSMDRLNGIYERVESVRGDLAHKELILAYENKVSRWLMAYVIYKCTTARASYFQNSTAWTTGRSF